MHSLSVSNVDIKDTTEDTNDDSVDTVALDANLSFFKNVGCEGLLLLFTAFTFFLVFGWLFLRYMEQWSLTRPYPFFFSLHGDSVPHQRYISSAFLEASCKKIHFAEARFQTKRE